MSQRMKGREDIQACVFALFAEQGWEQIALSDRIEQDLRARGDDLWPVFVALHDEFGVNFTTLDFDRFFHGEYYRIRDFVWAMLKTLLGKEISDREECTVAHLVAVSEEGYWFDPPPKVWSQT